MPYEVHCARTRLAASAAEVFAWHERPGAFERLAPPWEVAEVISRRGTIRDGDQTEVRVKVGPFSRRWVAVHRDFEAGRQFRDEQVKGPFAHWIHSHLVEPAGDGAATLEDRIEYALPLGALGRAFGGGYTRRKLSRMFDYRHETMAADLERHRVAAGRVYKIALTGASGLVGSALSAFLTTGGHTVVKLVRSAAGREPGDVLWDPAHGKIDGDELEGLDAVVHLAGESIAAGRWTPARKESIRDSRVAGTRLLAETLARLKTPPKVLVAASAIGYYGPRADEPVDESAPAGDDFLASVCREWEAATEPAARRGIRVVEARLGVVLSPKGGALAKMLPPFRLGAGGRVGDGKQVVSWVGLDDVVGALHYAVFTDSLTGPINVVAPAAVTNAELTKTLAHVLHRPAFMPLPAFAVKALFGEMGGALLLKGARVVPRRLTEAGFVFRYPELDGALRHLLGVKAPD